MKTAQFVGPRKMASVSFLVQNKRPPNTASGTFFLTRGFCLAVRPGSVCVLLSFLWVA